MREQPGEVPRTIEAGFALAQSDIDEFRAIMRQEFGGELSNQEAWSRVIELLHLYRSLLGPIPEDPEGRSGPSHVTDSSPPNWGKPDAL